MFKMIKSSQNATYDKTKKKEVILATAPHLTF